METLYFGDPDIPRTNGKTTQEHVALMPPLQIQPDLPEYIGWPA